MVKVFTYISYKKEKLVESKQKGSREELKQISTEFIHVTQWMYIIWSQSSQKDSNILDNLLNTENVPKDRRRSDVQKVESVIQETEAI